MRDISDYLPRLVNDGPFITAHTFDDLRRRIADERLVLPIYSLSAPVEELRRLAPLVLPPLDGITNFLPSPMNRWTSCLRVSSPLVQWPELSA